jgi:hypothetical protein
MRLEYVNRGGFKGEFGGSDEVRYRVVASSVEEGEKSAY